MAFGERGQWRVMINGVPFRMDGDSYEAAEEKVWDMLEASDGALFDQRARALGLSEDDVEGLRLADEAGSKNLGDAAFSQANRGRITESQLDEAGGNGLNQMRIGAGRAFVDRWRGLRQMTAEMMGDEHAAAVIEEEDRDERELFKKLDDQGVGAEDIGELGADMALLLGVAAVAPEAAGAQLASAAGAGALLAASTVKDAQAATSRLFDAGLGAAGALAGPAIGKAVGGVSSLASRFRPGVSIPVKAAGAWLRFQGLAGRRGATANVVDDALVMMASTNKSHQILGRAALDRVQQIVSRLPADATKGLKNEALFGALRQAVRKATVPTTSGVNVFDGAIFEREASHLLGQLGNMFEKPQQQLAAASIGAIAKGLQGLPAEVAERTAGRAAAALMGAPAEAQAFRKALEMASNPSVRESMLEGLADIGGRVLDAGPGLAANSFVSALGLGAAEDTKDMIENKVRSYGDE